jgi:hypothetical protein
MKRVSKPEAAAMVDEATAEARASVAAQGVSDSRAPHAEAPAAEEVGNKANLALPDGSSDESASTWGVDSAVAPLFISCTGPYGNKNGKT